MKERMKIMMKISTISLRENHFKMNKVKSVLLLLLVLVWVVLFSFSVSAAIVQNLSVVKSSPIADGVTFTHQKGTASAGVQNIYSIRFNGKDSRYGLVLGGNVHGRQTVPEMGAALSKSGAFKKVLAGVNGDHFSFQTGIPMGMSISNGEILTSPVEPYDADEYFFQALGIRKDGSVVAGENPVLNATYTVGGKTYGIEQINRTREVWAGGQLCLFTPAYGTSTDTLVGGWELVIRVTSGGVNPGGSLKGKVIAIEDEGNAELKEGTVVLSGCLDRLADVQSIAVGTEISMNFTFKQPEWNDVQFAVGGHYAIVRDGVAQHKDYKVDVFSKPQPRTALGIKADGTVVLTAVDGRSAASTGMTANEMADYLANEVGCKYAILMDGGGSTAMTAAIGNADPVIVNVPSETRAVGNGVFLVEKKQAVVTKAPKATPIPKVTPVKNVVSENPASQNLSSADSANSSGSDGISSVPDKQIQQSGDQKKKSNPLFWILNGLLIGGGVLVFGFAIFYLVLLIRKIAGKSTAAKSKNQSP